MTDPITCSIFVTFPAELAMRPLEAARHNLFDKTLQLHRIVNELARRATAECPAPGSGVVLDPLDDAMINGDRRDPCITIPLYRMRFCEERGKLCFESIRAVTHAEVEDVVRRLRMLIWLDPSIIANSGKKCKDLAPVDMGETRGEHGVLEKWCAHWTHMRRIHQIPHNKLSIEVFEWVKRVRRLAQNVARLGYVETNGSMSAKEVHDGVFWERTDPTQRQKAWSAFSFVGGENVGEQEV